MGESIYQAARQEKKKTGEAGRQALDLAQRKAAEGRELLIKIQVL